MKELLLCRVWDEVYPLCSEPEITAAQEAMRASGVDRIPVYQLEAIRLEPWFVGILYSDVNGLVLEEAEEAEEGEDR